jgi:hypothetical protein
MNSGNLLISRLNPRYFWDVDVAGLNAASDRRLVIERVFSMGEVDEMHQVTLFYGEKVVLEVLSNLSYIDTKTLNFISKLFNKPRKEFRCYTRMQSRPLHWSL